MLLYNHFNTTLWRKISEAGPNFFETLQLFRKKNEIFEAVCLRTLERGEIQDERETSKKKYTQMCKQMTRKTTTNLAFTKRRIQQKWNSVEETSPENSLSNTGRHDNHDLKYTPVLMCKDPS